MRAFVTIFMMLVPFGVAVIAASMVAPWIGPAAHWIPPFVFLVGFVYFVRSITVSNRVSRESLNLIQQGRFKEAVDKLNAAPRHGLMATMTRYYRGTALLHLWHLDDAERDLLFVAKTRFRSHDLSYLAPPLLALTSALQGRADAARKWIEKARTEGNGASGNCVLAKAVIAARNGDWQEARALLQRYEIKLLGGPLRGLADGLYVWCIEKLTGERRHVDRVAVFGEGGTDSLRKYWPELTAFLEDAPLV